MASKALTAAVTQNADGETWDFECPLVGQCGDLGAGVPFRSTEWPTKTAALARGQQHFDEHNGKGAMQELSEFRIAQGLQDRPVSLEDED